MPADSSARTPRPARARARTPRPAAPAVAAVVRVARAAAAVPPVVAAAQVAGPARALGGPAPVVAARVVVAPARAPRARAAVAARAAPATVAAPAVAAAPRPSTRRAAAAAPRRSPPAPAPVAAAPADPAHVNRREAKVRHEPWPLDGLAPANLGLSTSRTRELWPFDGSGSGALETAAPAAELGDDLTVGLPLDRHVRDAAAPECRAHVAVGDEHVTEPARRGEGDVGAGRHREAPPRVAGEREARIGQGEDVAAVADGVTVDHVVADRHPHDGVVLLDDGGLHAEASRGHVVVPHLPGEGDPGLDVLAVPTTGGQLGLAHVRLPSVRAGLGR